MSFHSKSAKLYELQHGNVSKGRWLTTTKWGDIQKNKKKEKGSKIKVGTLPVIIIRFLHPNRESEGRKEKGHQVVKESTKHSCTCHFYPWQMYRIPQNIDKTGCIPKAI